MSEPAARQPSPHIGDYYLVNGRPLVVRVTGVATPGLWPLSFNTVWLLNLTDMVETRLSAEAFIAAYTRIDADRIITDFISKETPK